MKVFFCDATKLKSSRIIEKLSILSDIEKQKFNTIKNKKRRLEFLAGRVIAREQLGKILKIFPNKIKIHISSNGALLIKNKQKFYISISHSNFLVAVAISKFPIGLDIEYKKEKKNLLEILNRIYQEEKNNFFLEFEKLGKKAQQDFFYDYWTKKEATFKFNSLIKASKLRYQGKVKNFHNIENYSCALSTSSFRGRIEFKELEFF